MTQGPGGIHFETKQQDTKNQQEVEAFEFSGDRGRTWNKQLSLSCPAVSFAQSSALLNTLKVTKVGDFSEFEGSLEANLTILSALTVENQPERLIWALDYTNFEQDWIGSWSVEYQSTELYAPTISLAFELIIIETCRRSSETRPQLLYTLPAEK